jgi:TolB protein
MRHQPDYSDYKPENWSVYKYDFETTKVTVFQDSALYVSVSPSGKQIAVGKISDGNRDIVVFDQYGRDPQRMTTHPAEDFAASFSPDERQIVFNSKRDGQTEIYSMRMDGTKLKRLTYTSAGQGCYNPQWSPDRKHIVYYKSTADGSDQICLMNAFGSDQRSITHDTMLNYFPTWISPQEILYARDSKNGTSTIYSISIDGKQNAPYLGIKSYYARASRDGDLIAYVDRDDRCIKVVSVEGDLIVTICIEA